MGCDGDVGRFLSGSQRFKFWDYVAARPATKVVGVYCKVDSTQFTWIPNLEAFVWADGQPRPQGEDNRLPFTFPEYSTQRYNIAVPYGKRTLSNSDIPLLAITAQQVMSQIMVLMNKSILTVLDNASNWGTSTADANTLNGGVGNWSTATSANLAIKQTFNAVAQKVSLFTNTVVGKSRLKCVIGTDAAKAIAASNEMADFLKQSPFAMAQVRGDDAQAKWSQYGLPNVLYGVDLVIDDGVITTQRQGDPSRTQAYLKDSTKALFMTVAEKTDGDQVGGKGETTFNPSTFHLFQYTGAEDGEKRIGGTVLETWDDVRNKRIETHVVSDFCPMLVAPESGYCVTNVI